MTWLSRRRDPWRRDRSLRRLDRALERHVRATRREVRRRVRPYVRAGEGFGALNARIPHDEREAVRELLRRVDVGPARPDADVFDLVYDLLDDVARGRR